MSSEKMEGSPIADMNSPIATQNHECTPWNIHHKNNAVSKTVNTLEVLVCKTREGIRYKINLRNWNHKLIRGDVEHHGQKSSIEKIGDSLRSLIYFWTRWFSRHQYIMVMWVQSTPNQLNPNPFLLQGSEYIV